MEAGTVSGAAIGGAAMGEALAPSILRSTSTGIGVGRLMLSARWSEFGVGDVTIAPDVLE